jgi:Protein of unknown function (DUF1217)
MSGFTSSILSLYQNIGSDSSSNSADDALLNTLFGNSGTTSAIASGISPITALQSAQKTETTGVAATEKQASVQIAMTAFTKAVDSATTVSQALNNPAVLNVLLTANGMSDQIGNTALAVNVLTSNLTDSNSLANVLTDTRWKTLAQTYNLNANGLKALQSTSVQSAIAQGYAQITWENAQDAQTPGISNALTFLQQAGTITNVDQLLGNETLLNVVETALDIPDTIAVQDLGAQEQAITSRLNVSQLQDPAFAQRFVDQYMIMNNSGSSAATSSTDLTTLAVQAETA